ncbi:MAG TPA: HEAT repeat domain-containing protein [Actinomycetota bacterium]|nr:HEAT repeat domain-containing protein [Actinomycetota bacterium]
MLRVGPGEERVALLLLTMMIVVWTGFALGGNAVESLLFVRFGPEALPYLFVTLGVLTFALMLGLNAMLGRTRPRRMLLSTLLGMGAFVIVMRLLLMLDARWLYPPMWLLMMVMWTVGGVAAWGIAGAVHDTRQAKRLFPLYVAGLILGWAIGGFGTAPLARWFGAENLLFFWAAGLGGAFLLARSALRVGGAMAESRRSRGRGSVSVRAQLSEGLRSVRESPLLFWMAITLALLALLYFSLAFLFARAATARFPEADRLAGFLGLFMGATNGMGLLVSLFVANRLFARFGVAAMVLVLAALYVAGFGVLAVSLAFVPLVVFRFAQMVWVNGVWTGGWQALYNVVPTERRDRTRTIIDGGALQGGIVLAGLLLILSERSLAPRSFVLIALAIAVVAAITANQMRRAYAGAVVEALRAGNPEVFIAEEEPFGGVRRDAAAMSIVMTSASNADPAVRRIAMEILAEVAGEDDMPTILEGLRDEDPLVRASALRGVARIGSHRALPDVSRLLSDGEVSVRLAAVDAFLAGGGTGKDADRLRSLLSDPDPDVRARASAGLLASPHADEAQRTLWDMVRSQSPEWRAAALGAFGGAEQGTEAIVSGLDDPHPLVRRAAALALSERPGPTASEGLVRALGDSDAEVRAAAVRGIVRMGDRARDALVAALARPELEAGAMHCLARMEGVDVSVLRDYVRREISEAVRYGGLLRILREGTDDRTDLVAHLLRYLSIQHAVNGLHAASNYWDPVGIRLAIENLASKDHGQRANALETLEAVGEPDVVRPLLAVWEGTASPSTDGASVLAELMRDRDPWLRASAAFASVGRAELRSDVEELARFDGDTLVREAATVALEGERVVEALPSLSLMERIVFLRRVPLFVDLSPADLKHVAEAATEQIYPDGEVIAEQGEPGDEMYVVLSGELRVLVSRDGGDPTEVARRVPGEYVGEMAVITQAPRMASLVAAGQVRALAIDRRRFERILRERPEASLAVMRELCNRLVKSVSGTPEARA